MQNLKDKLKKKLSHPSFADHKTSFSRRDFVRYGLLSAGATFLPLSHLDKAMAAILPKPRIPFLVFDLSGGASMVGNFLVGQKGGPEDLVNDYKNKGWNPRSQGAYSNIFGLPMNVKTGQMFAGLKETLPKEIFETPNQNFLKMTSMCHFSISDNPDNELSAITLITKAGLLGRFESNGVGPKSSTSGGYSAALMKDSSYRPKSVNSLRELLALPQFSGEYELLPAKMRQQTIEGLIKSAGTNKELANIYAQLKDTGVSRAEMNPTINESIYNLYPIANAIQNDTVIGTQLELQAGIVYNALAGNIGPGVVQITECDYHFPDQPEIGANKDLEIGQAIGRAVHAAHLMKTPLFFQIISDGGIASASDHQMIWEGDENFHTLSVMGYFDPTGNVNQQKLQLGHYTPEGTVEIGGLMGMGANKHTEMMVKATLLNYLNLNGMTSQFDTIGGRLPDGTTDQLLSFG